MCSIQPRNKVIKLIYNSLKFQFDRVGLGSFRAFPKKGESSFKKAHMGMPLPSLSTFQPSPCLLPVILSPCIPSYSLPTRLFSSPLLNG
nr:MAG TPA: hypothetical protein [Caudoviricetes sp.]